MTDAAVTMADATGAQGRRPPSQYTWAALAASTNGVPVQRPGEKSTLQITGTFGGTVVMQGSEDGTNYFTLKDRWGNAVSTTAAAAFELQTLPAYVRPSAGTGVSSVVAVLTVTNI